MAKRNQTPDTILNAPRFTPVQVVEHKGLNRAQRRLRSKRLPGVNVPYRKQAGVS